VNGGVTGGEAGCDDVACGVNGAVAGSADAVAGWAEYADDAGGPLAGCAPEPTGPAGVDGVDGSAPDVVPAP
jgi:hypothetical protein